MTSAPARALSPARPVLLGASVALVTGLAFPAPLSAATSPLDAHAGRTDDTAIAAPDPTADDRDAFVQAPPFDSDRWTIDAREHRIEEHLGRTALVLKGGIVF